MSLAWEAWAGPKEASAAWVMLAMAGSTWPLNWLTPPCAAGLLLGSRNVTRVPTSTDGLAASLRRSVSPGAVPASCTYVTPTVALTAGQARSGQVRSRQVRAERELDGHGWPQAQEGGNKGGGSLLTQQEQLWFAHPGLGTHSYLATRMHDPAFLSSSRACMAGLGRVQLVPAGTP